MLGEHVGDEATRPDPAHDESFGAKLSEGALDRDAGETEVGGQGAGGGQPLSRCECTLQDRAADTRVELAMQWRARVGDADERGQQGSGG